MNTTGSQVFTPNRKLAMKRARPNANTIPMAAPIKASRIP